MTTQIVATTTEDVAKQFEFTRDELRAKLSEDLPTAITTTADYKAVMKALSVRRSLRGEIDSTRQSLNELALKHQRAVNAYAKELVAIVEESEGPLKRLKKAEDERRTEEKRAKEEAERRAREEEIRLQREAEEARLRAEREAEEKRLAEERAKLEAEQERLEAEKRAAEEAARKEQERIDAEQKRLAAERRDLDEQRRKAEAEQARIRAEREAAERAERERMEKEKRISAALALPQETWESDNPLPIQLRDLDDPRIVARRTEALAVRKRREAEEAAVREQERQAALARRLEALRPDREKALAYIDQLLDVTVPKLADEDFYEMVCAVHDELVERREALEYFGKETAAAE